jgi:hypothetical protein
VTKDSHSSTVLKIVSGVVEKHTFELVKQIIKTAEIM